MEELGSARIKALGPVRRKRSRTFRKPKVEASPVSNESSKSSTPPSDDVSKVSSDEKIGGDPNSMRNEFSLNQCISRDASSTRSALNHKQSSEGGGSIGSEIRVKTVRLKVGGITRTLQGTTSSLVASGSESSLRSSRNSDAHRTRHKEDSDDAHSSRYKNISFRGIPWKNFSDGGNPFFPMKKMRKGKRASKKRVDASSEEDEDAEIKYLERMKNAKVAVLNRHLEEETSNKKLRISGVSKKHKSGENLDDLSSKLGRDGRKSSRLEKSKDADYEEEEELTLEIEHESKQLVKLNKDSVDSTGENKREPTLTIRQRALLSGKDASPGSNGIEFPNGLPPAPPRKQKEKLTEVEQQLRKTEAAQRRRMQLEKAARESEAEAIRKILGQDSSRKKRDDKNKRRQEELQQEKAANALKLASDTVRWVISPSGTTVTFPNEMGLPSIFNPRTRSYPAPREKCAGPSCNNPYKYRDSKSNLPLCSLKCYKAVQPKEIPADDYTVHMPCAVKL